jgi:hypothetical protein
MDIPEALSYHATVSWRRTMHTAYITADSRQPFPALVGILVVLLAVMTACFSARADEFDSGDYAAVLSAFVDDRGMVDYRGLSAHRERLDSFADALASLPKATYESLSEPEKIAFLINAYNGLTLRAVIDHYPIEPSGVSGLIFPDNSIRQIPGVWDELAFEVMGESWTLDRIEHDTLRVDFDEPRIHLALVCAAMGCPPLRNEPYTGERLDSQLDDQADDFLSNPLKFHIDREGGVVFLSSIFKWYGEDFILSFGADDRITGHTRAERAVLNYITGFFSHRLSDADRAFLEEGDFKIEYLPYDWSLNEQ